MMKFPTEWENKSHVSNHQPVISFSTTKLRFKPSLVTQTSLWRWVSTYSSRAFPMRQCQESSSGLVLWRWLGIIIPFVWVSMEHILLAPASDGKTWKKTGWTMIFCRLCSDKYSKFFAPTAMKFHAFPQNLLAKFSKSSVECLATLHRLDKWLPTGNQTWHSMAFWKIHNL